MNEVRRENKIKIWKPFPFPLKLSVICIIICGIWIGIYGVVYAADSESTSGEIDPYFLNTYAAAHIQVANVTLDPLILMPEDVATVTLVMENTGKDMPVAISDAAVISKDLKVLTERYNKVGTIGPGNQLPLTFTLQAGVKSGIYYPVFSASFRGAHFLRYPFPVTVQDTPVILSIQSKPDAWVEGKRGQIILNLMNPRDNPVTSVMITPEPSAHEILPTSSFVGVLDPDSPVLIPFNITPNGDEPVTFTLSYKNGMNKHTATSTLPITPGTSKKQADLFVSNIEVSPGAGYVIVKGDVTNAGLETANAVVIAVKDPAEAVYPYKQYGVGMLKPSEFASFQVTFKPSSDATSETITSSFKDADGRIITTETPIDISGATSLLNMGDMTDLKGSSEPVVGSGSYEFIVGGIIAGIAIGSLSVYFFMRRRNKKDSGDRLPDRKTNSNSKLNGLENGGKESDERYKRGMAKYKDGEWKEAAEIFHAIVEDDQVNHRAWNAYGICLTKLGEYKEAGKSYENALLMQPGNASYEKNRDINAEKMK